MTKPRLQIQPAEFSTGEWQTYPEESGKELSHWRGAWRRFSSRQEKPARWFGHLFLHYIAHQCRTFFRGWLAWLLALEWPLLFSLWKRILTDWNRFLYKRSCLFFPSLLSQKIFISPHHHPFPELLMLLRGEGMVLFFLFFSVLCCCLWVDPCTSHVGQDPIEVSYVSGSSGGHISCIGLLCSYPLLRVYLIHQWAQKWGNNSKHLQVSTCFVIFVSQFYCSEWPIFQANILSIWSIPPICTAGNVSMISLLVFFLNAPTSFTTYLGRLVCGRSSDWHLTRAIPYHDWRRDNPRWWCKCSANNIWTTLLHIII